MMAKRRARISARVFLVAGLVIIGVVYGPAILDPGGKAIQQASASPDACNGDSPPGSTQGYGTVCGMVLDPEGNPVYAIDVALVPVEKTGEEERWRATYRDWTNKKGQYLFTKVSPGKYVLGVHIEGAPNAKHPFATMYYPRVDGESGAEHLVITGSQTLKLEPLQVRRLKTATIKIQVVWQDGSPVERSNLLFHNPSYSQGVIGNEAPQISDGEGEFVVPVGFRYFVRAAVNCDAGDKIETIESRPVQEITVDDYSAPGELTFVIPSRKCKLWEPPKPV